MVRRRSRESKPLVVSPVVLLLLTSGCYAWSSDSVGQCEPSRVTVTAHSDAAKYSLGETPHIWIQVQNKGFRECEMEVGADVQHFVIHEGPGLNSDIVWSSRDCEVPAKPAWARFQSGQVRSTAPIPWDRTPSAPDVCLEDRAQVAPGEYFFRAEIAGVMSVEPVRFVLSD